jgi:hypothetical protein
MKTNLPSTNNQLSLTRAALSACRRAKSKFLSVKFFVAALMLLLGFTFVGCTPAPPTEADAKKAVEMTRPSFVYVRVTDASAVYGTPQDATVSVCQLVAFHKTNGQKQELSGVKAYKLDFEAEIEYTRNGWMCEGNFGTTYFLVANQKGEYAKNSETEKKAEIKKGDRFTRRGWIAFEMSEKGWMVKNIVWE